MEAFTTQEHWFRENLSGETSKRFDELISCHNNIVDTMSYENFRTGFRLGVIVSAEYHFAACVEVARAAAFGGSIHEEKKSVQNPYTRLTSLGFLVSSICGRPRSSDAIFFISSSVSSKFQISMFSSMRFRWIDFGITMTPF